MIMLAIRLLQGGELQAYRFYRLDGAGKFLSADWIEAEDDDSALGEASKRTEGSKFELWHGDRLVGPHHAGAIEP